MNRYPLYIVSIILILFHATPCHSNKIILDTDKNVSPIKELVAGFLKVDPVTIKTVNMIFAPTMGNASFLIPVFLLIIISALILLIAGFARKKSYTRHMVFVFLFFALIFSLRMDYGWAVTLYKDLSSSGSFTEKHANLEWSGRNAYFYARDIKRLIPDASSIRIYKEGFPGGSYFWGKLKYFLLPIKISDEGSYVFLHNKGDIKYDIRKKSLMKKGELIATNVLLLSRLGIEAELYEIKGVLK